jgi:hypothetical protein
MPPINTGDRKELGKLLQSLAAGDQVLATRIDRLARSMFELFAIVKKIIDAGDNFSTRETTLTMVRPLRLHWAGNHLPQLWTSTASPVGGSRTQGSF